MDPNRPPLLRRILRRLNNSKPMLLALTLQILFLLVAGSVVIRTFTPPVEEMPGNYRYIVSENDTPPPPPNPDEGLGSGELDRQMESSQAPVQPPDIRQKMTDLIKTENSDSNFKLDVDFGRSLPDLNLKLPPKPNLSPVPKPVVTRERAEAIKKRLGLGGPGGSRHPFGIHSPEPGVTGIRAKFTCYVGRYAQGDWNHNLRLDASGQRIIFGSIPNLMTQIKRWNRQLDAAIEARPLDLASEELFRADPPAAFIYLTGHRDFTLTEAEVANLRRFVFEGGVIWGDNGLPGHHSRFDIAFRREMRRVLPDPDQELLPLDPDHAIFTQKGSLLRTLPAGVNFSAFPVEAARMDGKIAVLYTPNSYGNLWQIALDERGRVLEVFDEGTVKQPHNTYTARHLWSRRHTYYRNVDEQSVTQAYQLGINIICHILLQHHGF
ncbi:MAG: DUF4159 domain-containing protein [Verrucomicrobiae bacterium]|nr:DUF4159 domain-containing protein [Verrucomicrobiae bacterium]